MMKMMFSRVRLALMSALLLLVQDAAAFYLPGLAPVSFCEKPQDGKDAQRECQVTHCVLFNLLAFLYETK